MKLKLDENLPSELKSFLSGICEVDTVLDEGLRGFEDDDVWSACQAENRLFITQDLDFSDIRKYLPGTHGGVVLLRLRNPSRGAIVQKIVEIANRSDISSWSGAFVIVTDSKIRVRR